MSNDKLPTAEKTLGTYSAIATDLDAMQAVYVKSTVLLAMQEHTSAHTAALRQEVEELQSQLAKYRELMQEFVDRVERGEVRSKRTYEKFKQALKEE